MYILLLTVELELCRMSFYFNKSALSRSDNNQHNDSQTYCDALFIFVCVWLPATIWQPSHSNVFGLQAVRSEKGKMAHILPIYHANAVFCGAEGAQAKIHRLAGSIVHKHKAPVWHNVYPEGG